MKMIWGLVVSATLISSCGCSVVTEKDLTGLTSSSLFQKRQVIEAIGERKIPTFFPFKLFSDKKLAEEAATVIARFLEEGKDDPEMQLSMLTALEKLSRFVDVPVESVAKKLDEENPAIRSRAVEVLARLDSEDAVSALLNALDREEEGYSIIWALGEIGSNQAVPQLNALLACEDEFVSYNAYRALEKIAAKSDNKEKRLSGFTKQVFAAVKAVTLGNYKRTMRKMLDTIVRLKGDRAGRA